MKRKVVDSEDGSSTLFVPELNEHYHSVHGAIQESLHIFIRAGVEFYGQKDIHILEAGFGTGLNAYLTLVYASQHKTRVTYHSVEKYPLTPAEASQLNYMKLIDFEQPELFSVLHECPWDKECEISPYFKLYKHSGDFATAVFSSLFDIVFFDAFNPDVQPRLWEENTLTRFSGALKPEGIFITYCVKGIVKQALRNLGLSVKRLPGPPGKREMLRATKSK